MMRGIGLGLLTAGLLVGGCGDDGSAGAGAGGATATTGIGGGGAVGGAGGAGGTPTTFGGDRPVELMVPDGYDGSAAAPLMILLHGYSASGTVQEMYFGLGAIANQMGMLYAHPDGTVDAMSNGFWNATDACCDFYSSGVDDSGYLRQLVDDVRAAYNVDEKRIYLIGHSNGGFMSYRMACDHADIIAAIVSLAGATFSNAANCNPSEPVHVLQIHGDADGTIQYGGGDILGTAYPGAIESVEQWASGASCDLNQVSDGGTLDLDTGIAGDETSVARYDQGCASGGSAELWTIAGGAHVPDLGANFAGEVVDFMLAHPKP
jgi:polyhydroxybutyrate depolymerase